MDGGDGGLSLISNIAGRHMHIVMRDIIVMKVLNLPWVSSTVGIPSPSSGSYSSFESKIMTIKI